MQTCVLTTLRPAELQTTLFSVHSSHSRRARASSSLPLPFPPILPRRRRCVVIPRRPSLTDKTLFNILVYLSTFNSLSLHIPSSHHYPPQTISSQLLAHHHNVSKRHRGTRLCAVTRSPQRPKTKRTTSKKSKGKAAASVAGESRLSPIEDSPVKKAPKEKVSSECLSR